MPYVYRYKDTFDDRYKYIGIVKGDTHNLLERRIKQHRKDDWFKSSQFYVDYIHVSTICDAESIEGHLIAKYETFKFYNVAKKKWGQSSLFDVEDEKFVEYGIESLQEMYRKQIEGMERDVQKIIKKKESLEAKLAKEYVIEHTAFQYGMNIVDFSEIKNDLLERSNLYESFSVDCSTRTSANKWAYRASRLRHAAFAVESAIMERLTYPYSDEYRDDSTSQKWGKKQTDTIPKETNVESA